MKKEVLLCQHCGNKTSHTIISQGIEEEKYFDSETLTQSINIPFNLWFTNCDTCKHHSLFSCLNSDANESYSLFPPEKVLSEKIPMNIRNAYKEALKVKKHSEYAFIILIRRALELICIQEKAKGKNLLVKIKDLGAKGILPSKLSDMADMIRLIGNNGAHTSEILVNEYDIEILDEFFAAITDYIYCVHHKVELLRKKAEK